MIARLEQFGELIFGQARVADEGAERSLGEFAVVGNSETTTRRVTENEVTAGLMVNRVANLAEGFDRIRARATRKTAHRATSTMASVMGAGMGSPCFLRLAR